MATTGSVVASAPVRADLAGGTLDLWPLGLFHPGSVTIAVAVDLRVRALVERRAKGGATVRSTDLRHTRSLARAAFEHESSVVKDRLELLERVVRAVAPQGGVRLTTTSPVRAGSGLGTSSALGIAAAAALVCAQRRTPDGASLVPLVRDLEAQVLGIPTGTQDHHAAWHGGIVCCRHLPGGSEVVRIAGSRLRALDAHLVLVDSVQARSSGPSNWDMYRRRIEGDRGAVRALAKVCAAGLAAAEALDRADWRALGRAMSADLRARLGWSPLVMTRSFARLFAAARRAGALGAKVCGAGGGGFGVVLVPPERRDRVRRALIEAGGVVPGAGATATGLELAWGKG